MSTTFSPLFVKIVTWKLQCFLDVQTTLTVCLCLGCCSVSSLMTTTEAVVADFPKEEKEMVGMGGMGGGGMGGMGGMDY